jgi:hypothetical protein
MKLHLIRNIQPGIAIFLSRNDTLKSLNTLQYFILANNVYGVTVYGCSCKGSTVLSEDCHYLALFYSRWSH